jgi:protein-disulfide isomerase
LHRSHLRRLAAAGLLAVSLAAAGCGDDGGRSTQATEHGLRGAASLESRFAGVPQRGAVLGRADAPVTLVEFADLQCPFCARFDRAVLPAVIEEFVRPGRLRIELRPVSFLGPDSSTGAAATVAAGYQNRMWQFADLFYRNQGAENSGYATPAFLGRVARAAGLDFERWERESNSRRLVATLEGNARAAHTARVNGTPNFRLGRTGGVLTPLAQGPGAPDDFMTRLRRALARLRPEG